MLDHGHQVEDLLFYPSGGVLVSAGDNVVKIWDVLGGFNVLDTLTAHQKTVMSLALDSTRTRLFTAGADQLVKIYDTTSYKVTHTIKYQAPIMSIAVSVSPPCYNINAIVAHLCAAQQHALDHWYE